MIRVVPFGAFEGFSDEPILGTHFYSQGMSPTLFGTGTVFSMVSKASSAVLTGLGQIKHIAVLGGFMFLQDDSGQIWKEATVGGYDFAKVRSPGGNGSGMFADQYGNLFYSCGTSNNQLGKYDGTALTWNDTFQTLSSGQHPMDWYEDLILIANTSTVSCLFSDGSFSLAAFSLPTELTITAIRSGPTGILIGANMGNRGAIILWDGNALRSKVPWKWVTGNILSIEPYGENWLVKTDRQVLITNGITIKEFFGIFDDPLTFHPYSSALVLPQQMTFVNDVLFFTITASFGDVSQFGKKKPGLYLYFMTRKAWCYIPVPTGEKINIVVNAVYFDIQNNRIVVSYSNNTTNFLAAVVNQAPTTAQFISEETGLGRIKYQRVYFGPTDKTLEGVVLNLGLLNSATEATPLSFNVSLKVYNFRRQLWGHAKTSASLLFPGQIQIDGTQTGSYDAQIGDEVTILEGVNAGFIAHITNIAYDGLYNETWNLDRLPTYNTEIDMNVQVQPYKLVTRQTFTTLSELKNVFFSVNGIKGKQFLLKVVFDGIQSGLALELQTSYFVFNDIGWDQT
jgi:hypothetical protein